MNPLKHLGIIALKIWHIKENLPAWIHTQNSAEFVLPFK